MSSAPPAPQQLPSCVPARRRQYSNQSARWFALLSISLAAVALALPAFCGPMRTNDSFWIDWVWLDQFARELAHGTVYPRWLPLSHHGLGSPVFYYYPPLAFYAGSAFVFAGLSTYGALLMTFLAAYLLSGMGVYWWLKQQARSPLMGALVYLAAPYHAYNFYVRGAVAEIFASAVLPFVLVGLRKVAKREPGGFVLAAVSYAALIMSHLPLALLASIFLIGPYALLETRNDVRRLFTTGAALASGLALAAVYLLPAFLLEPYRDTAKLWENPVLHPSNWTFWNPQFRTWQNYDSILVIGVALLIPLVALAIRPRSGWAKFGILCVVLAVGTVPAIWALPLLRSVQFPFRLLPLAEFALATAIAVQPTRAAERTIAWIALLAVTVPVTGSSSPQAVSVPELRTYHPDVPENLPPGKRPYSWPSKWALEVADKHRNEQSANGITIAPVFAYPSWQVRCSGHVMRTFADRETQLLSYRGPLGCTLSLTRTRWETLGLAISLIAAFALLLGSLFLGRRTDSRMPQSVHQG